MAPLSTEQQLRILAERLASSNGHGLSPLDLSNFTGWRYILAASLNSGDPPEHILERLDEDMVRQLFECDPDEESVGESRGNSLTVEAPPLPRLAHMDPAIGVGACPWLDQYIDFSRKWSPRAYDAFHEACGIWVLSTVAARRVAVECGDLQFPSLYIGLAGRTSLYAKTTTGGIAIDALRQAGLDWLLAPDDATPQKFVADLAGRVPLAYDAASPEQQARIRMRLALPAQRGWFYEEFGQKLRAMMREGGFMADFHGILRRFHDCPERYEYGTIGRGSDIVERPYLALLATVTPADLRRAASTGSQLWGDGFWARFVFVTPPEGCERSKARFPQGRRSIPARLTKPLVEWHQRLGLPRVTLESIQDENGQPIGGKRAVRVGLTRVSVLTMETSVWDAFYAYHDALIDLTELSDNQDLDGGYTRLATTALRVATLIASLEGNEKIMIEHWACAQRMAERWRMGLHHIYEQANAGRASKSKELEDRIMDLVTRKGALTIREMSRLTRSASSAELEPVVNALVPSDSLVAIPSRRTTRYALVCGVGVNENHDRLGVPRGHPHEAAQG